MELEGYKDRTFGQGDAGNWVPQGSLIGIMLAHVFTKSLKDKKKKQGGQEKLVTIAADSTAFFREVKNQFWITRVAESSCGGMWWG